MKRLVPVAMVLILCCKFLHAQEAPRGKYIIYNIGINAILGGMGAVVNKTDDQKLYKNFLKGFGKGALGGALIYTGKETTYLINSRKSLWYTWPARILTSAGSSIVTNGMYNRGVFDRFHFHLGFVRLDYDRKAGPSLLGSILPPCSVPSLLLKMEG